MFYAVPVSALSLDRMYIHFNIIHWPCVVLIDCFPSNNFEFQIDNSLWLTIFPELANWLIRGIWKFVIWLVGNWLWFPREDFEFVSPLIVWFWWIGELKRISVYDGGTLNLLVKDSKLLVAYGRLRFFFSINCLILMDWGAQTYQYLWCRYS